MGVDLKTISNYIKKILFIILLLFPFVNLRAQIQESKSLIVLGDVHFDKWEDHDSTWLAAHPDDYRQVTEEYCPNTKNNFVDLINEILIQSKKPDLNVAGILQLGDFVEGLTGRPDLAAKMERDMIQGLRADEFTVPWILTKGNHEVTGPGAKEAYNSVVLPFIQKELHIPIKRTYYSYTIGDLKIICIDCYDDNLLSFLGDELTNTNAKFKIIATHQSVIPVTGRLWHIFANDSVKREKLLNLIAKNKAIVLCGHLHKYSVVSRTTPFGPIIQIMTKSVIGNRNAHKPKIYTTDYGPNLVDLEPSFNPGTATKRKLYLSKEAQYVTNFRMADLAGYSILNFNSITGAITLKVFSGLGEHEFEKVQLGLYGLKIYKIGNGTITVDPSDSTYLSGTKVQLKAEPDTGWKFSGWQGDTTGNKNPLTIKMTKAKEVRAIFTKK